MSHGLQTFDSSGAVVVDTSLYGLLRIIHAQNIVGNGPHNISPAGFNKTKAGHTAIVYKLEGYSLGLYKIEYPTDTSVRVTGYNGGTPQARVVVFAA